MTLERQKFQAIIFYDKLAEPWDLPLKHECLISHDWWPEVRLYKAVVFKLTLSTLWCRFLPKIPKEITLILLEKPRNEAAMLILVKLYPVQSLLQYIPTEFDWWEIDQSKRSVMVRSPEDHRAFGVGYECKRELVSHVFWEIDVSNLCCFFPRKYDASWKFRRGNNLGLTMFFLCNFQGEVMHVWRGNIQQTIWSWAAMWYGRSCSLCILREIKSPQTLFKIHLHS